MKIKYDNTPPTDPVSISLSEYNALKKAVVELLDCHTLIRKAAPLIRGEVLTEQDRYDLEVLLDHFNRVYLV